MHLKVLASFILLAAVLPCMADSPFRLPVAATVTGRGADEKGWRESGVMTVPFPAARQSFISSVSAYGWRCVHSIPMGGNDRVLVLWRRGDEDLTVMLWRIDVNRTGFSWGLGKQKNKGAK